MLRKASFLLEKGNISASALPRPAPIQSRPLHQQTTPELNPPLFVSKELLITKEPPSSVPATPTFAMAVSGFNTPSWRPSTPVPGVDYKNTGKSFVRDFAGLLFDMDGTLIDSTSAIVKFWSSIGEKYGFDPKVILATSHGRRSIDVFQQIDPSRANWESVRQLEGQVPLKYGADAVEIPGARYLLSTLEDADAPWAIVTSGTRPLVEGWLRVLSLAEPNRLVTAEDVQNGKPDPACYKLGRHKLGLAASASALVLEDAPAGIRAGKAAGCMVLALATTHPIEQLRDAGADWVVRDLRSVRFLGSDRASGGVRVEVSDIIE